MVGAEAFTVASMGGEKRCADCGIFTYLGPFDAVWEFVLDKCVCVTASTLSIGLNGGPICNTKAQVDRGVDYLNFADLSRAILGIPGENFLAVRDELIQHGRRTTVVPRAWLGVLSYTLREHVVIAGVMPGAPGEKAGLQQGDLGDLDRRQRRQRSAISLRDASQSSSRRKHKFESAARHPGLPGRHSFNSRRRLLRIAASPARSFPDE